MPALVLLAKKKINSEKFLLQAYEVKGLFLFYRISPKYSREFEIFYIKN